MAVQRVLDRQVVQAELILHRAQEPLGGIDEPDPDERLRPLQRFLNLVEVDLADPHPALVGDAVDDAGFAGITFGRRDEDSTDGIHDIILQARATNASGSPVRTC